MSTGYEVCGILHHPSLQPGKHVVKNLFLDAIGEPRESPRRTATAGLQTAYTLNGGGSSRDVQVVLLDERYYRDTLPCSMREDWWEAGVVWQ